MEKEYMIKNENGEYVAITVDFDILSLSIDTEPAVDLKDCIDTVAEMLSFHVDSFYLEERDTIAIDFYNYLKNK